MSNRRRKNMILKIEVGPPAKGHYNFQGTKTVFDNRPKRLRTRNAQQRSWKDEQ